MDKIQKIIHVDMDAFYASVEQRDNPDLQGKPLVVGGSPQGRGVVCTASYEARKFGIKSAMSCAKAIKLCPKLKFIRPNLEKYKMVSRQIHKIFHEVTDVVEPLSLDEAYLDVTYNKFNEESATVLANYIRSRIKATVGLTASAGVSSLKFIAKIASDMNKPDGLTVIPPEDIFNFLTNLPVGKLWGVGKKTQERLQQLGIYTVEDIRHYPLAFFVTHFGRQGQFMYELAFGRDERKVGEGAISHSIANETTFTTDIVSWKDKEDKVVQFTVDLVAKLIAQKKKIKNLTVKVRFSDFETKTKSKTLLCYTDDYDLLISTAKALLQEIPDIQHRAIRLLGVTVKKFQGEANMLSRYQLELPLKCGEDCEVR